MTQSVTKRWEQKHYFFQFQQVPIEKVIRTYDFDVAVEQWI